MVPTTVSPNTAVAGVTASNAGAMPTPVKLADVVPPGEAVTLSVALFWPAVIAVSVTVTLHFAPASSVMPLHPSVTITISVESEIVVESAPVAAAPVFVMMKGTGLPACPCSTDPRLWFGGSIVKAPWVTPVPCSIAVTAPPIVAKTLIRATFSPAVVGANRIVTRQLFPPPMATLHPLLVIAYWAASVPSSVTVGMLVAACPVFEIWNVASA